MLSSFAFCYIIHTTVAQSTKQVKRLLKALDMLEKALLMT